MQHGKLKKKLTRISTILLFIVNAPASRHRWFASTGRTDFKCKKDSAKKKNKTKQKWVDVDTEKLKLSQRYAKKGFKTISEEGEVVKARRQLRTGRMIDEIITEMFSRGKVKMGPKIRDCRVIDVTDVSVSHDNKSATISWAFEGPMFIESNVYDEKYLDNIASGLAAKSSKEMN